MAVRNAIAIVALATTQVAALTPAGPWLAASNLRLGSAPGSGISVNATIKTYNMSVPIDHFHNETKYEPHSDGHFNLRYMVDASNYQEGGPVIILHSGESEIEGRLSYLEHGIASILAKATGGVGIVLEQRYYGESWPTDETHIESYRFLTTDQALADTAYFSKNLKIPGLEQHNLTAPGTPHILYGGSYAGGLVAIARKLYPDVFWGAISSSGNLTDVIDKQLLSGDKKREDEIKSLFGLRDLWNDELWHLLRRRLF
ncbi:hypothetical protein E4U22_007914 [Claviceps purpurea]|nr:hypothetical protein E4U22_007914 [Claviceps purpurea]